jgi:hypothetical protein
MPRPALYQIVDFDETFENNKSRIIDRCSWFANPNEDTIQWANLMSQGVRGAAVVAIFQQLVRVCSRQRKPRLGFLTHDGKRDGRRYTIAELAMVTYQTEDFIAEALNALASPEVNWIAIVTLRVTRVPPTALSALEAAAQHGSLAPREVPSKCRPTRHQCRRECPRSALCPRCRLGCEEEGRNEGKIHFPSSLKGDVVFLSQMRRNGSIPSSGDRKGWSYEEQQLLSRLLPIPKPDRALLSWAYMLPRDKEAGRSL